MRIEAKQRLLASHQFKYAMVNRPVGIGTCPKDFAAIEDRPAKGTAHYESARNGVAVYDRQLTDAETKNFEMAPMISNDDHVGVEKYADIVIDQFGEYAKRYMEFPDERLLQEVHQKLKSGCTGYVPSIDYENLLKVIKHKVG
jgi:hypothetical protein